MNNFPMKRWPLLLLVASYFVCMTGFADEKPASKLEILEKQFDTKVESEVTGPYKAAVDDLNKKYLASLDRVRQSAQQAAHLDEALAVTAEMERVKKGGSDSGQDDPKASPGLKNLVSIYRTSLARLNAERDTKARPLNETYARALDDLIPALTKEGKLEEAKSAREKLAQIKTATEPVPSGQAPLQEFLVGTKWWWNGNKSWEMTFKADGTVEQADWTRKGLVTGWRVVNPKEVRLTILRGRTTNKVSTLVFAEDRDSFTGTDFDRKHVVAKSERIKEADPASGTKPDTEKPSPGVGSK
jgi:hypothetical protein